MMLTYEITRWSHELAERALEVVTVKRADAANRHLRRMVRDMVAGEALLDRAAGVDLIRGAERMAYEAPGPGLYILDRWRIAGRDMGPRVEIFIHR